MKIKAGYVLILPAVILFIVFVGWSLVEVARLSLMKTNFITSEFIGIGNYVKTLSDRAFLIAIKNNLIYMALIVPGVLLVTIFICLTVFNLGKRWHDIIRFVVYIPVVASGVIIAQVWKWIYHPSGPINWILEGLGFDNVAFFATGKTGIPAITIIMIYQMIGGYVIILLANMLSIDRKIFDAARIDGANQRQINFKIILPMMKKPIAMIMLLTMIASMQIVETIMMLAPYEHTASITYNIYREGFLYSRHGLAASQAIILLLITIALTLVKNKVSNGKA